MGRSAIPYVNESWSPVTGCTPVSAGCDNCWSRAMQRRFPATHGEPGKVTLHPGRMDEPLRWRKPRTVACCFLGDLFHLDVPSAFIGDVLRQARGRSQHRFLFLTKRAERMRRALNDLERASDPRLNPIDHMWFGVSCEDQATADERIPILLDTPVAHRWVSLEPQIGPVNFRWWLDGFVSGMDKRGAVKRGPAIGWIVQGCESGPKRRPFDLAWARQTRDDCAASGVPYFLKQTQNVLCARAASDPGRHILACPSEECRECRRVVVHAPYLDGRQHLALPWEVKS